MKRKYTVLCVDDEKIVLDSLKEELKYRLDFDNLNIETADSGEYGLELFDEIVSEGHHVPVVISDQLMPGMKGDAFLIAINERNPEVRKILLTGQASSEAVGNALNKAGLYRFVSKPWNPEDLALTVQEAIKSYSREAELHTQVKKTNLLSTVNQYSQILSEALNLETLSERLLKALCQETGAERGVLVVYENPLPRAYVYDPQAEELVKKVSSRNFEKYFSPVFLKLAQQKQQIQTVGRAASADHLSTDTYVSEHQPQAMMAASLKRSDRMVGSLLLESRSQADLFTADQLELFEFVASQTAVSIDNAVLYEELQDKNEKITHSIQYAQRIQQSVLPSDDLPGQYFSDHFLLYRPRDIVSGDFYWWIQAHDHFYFSAIDCTGHGVPGAIMTMLANNLIDSSIRAKNLTETSDILQDMRQALRTLLKTEENTEMRDGMDMALCRWSPQSAVLQFSAAQMTMFLMQQDGELQEIKGDRIPIGERKLARKSAEEERFTYQEFEMQSGDCLYLFSDGMVDQFGGSQNKKFTTKRFRELVKAIAHRPMSGQKDIINNRLNIWMKDTEQTDDVLVMGFKC